MVIRLNKRVQAGAYKWLGGKHYWILDTKTGIKYKGLNEKNFETVSRLIKNSHDMDRLMSKMSHYTYEGRKEGLQRMEDNFVNLINFRYGSTEALSLKFRQAFKRINKIDENLWKEFVELNNEWFTEYWDYYGSGSFDPYSADENGNISDEKKAQNELIRQEGIDSLKAIIGAMNRTARSGKAQSITHDLKDYKTLDLNNSE